jgi:hypothetical protein
MDWFTHVVNHAFIMHAECDRWKVFFLVFPTWCARTLQLQFKDWSDWRNSFKKLGFLRYLTQTCGISSLGVFSDAFPAHKMRVHLLTAPNVLFIWVVTHTSTIWAQHCSTLGIKWVTVCLAWQDAVLVRKPDKTI